MQIKSLEIQGFKSFPDRVKFTFHSGITAVVGPNGSGKSNIVDAVRWVFGEQSTKTLRGSRMEDVIFGGTARRRPQSSATVTLVLANADRSLPVDSDEVAITRRFYRSGESEYRLDGNESFTDSSKVKMQTVLDNYHIYYEEQDGKLRVDNSDIPSAEVSRYYIKESAYFDQRTSTFRTKVVALCPVLMRSDDFGGEATPYPLFWLKYDDIGTYLARHTMMSSNYNNVTNMTAADYFSMNLYDGKIYKTNNMQGRVLANYCKTDSAMANEQKRIEKQLSDFEQHVWGHTTDSVAADSTAQEAEAVADDRKSARASRRRASSSTSRREEKKEEEAPKVSRSRRNSGNSGASAPRVTVRRQRR